MVRYAINLRQKILIKLVGGFMNNRKILSIFVLIVFMIFPIYANAAKTAPVSNTQLCLACHSDKTLDKKLMNKEILSLYINGSDFTRSVHGKTGCSGCHSDVTMDNHPKSIKIKNKKEFAANVARNCSGCHTPEQLRKRLPIHSSLAAKGSCLECHGSHYIMAAAVQKTSVKDNQYCMTCHSRKLSMSMKNGETLSVAVDESSLRNSVHGALKCIDCHKEFSMTEHPMRSFSSKRAYSLATADNCRKCHEKTYKQYEVSVHMDQLKGGNTKAPTCVDCHGDHSVAGVKQNKNIGIASCNKCHSDMNASYEASMHGKAWKKGDEKAPSCSSCHSAHDIASGMTTKIQEGCLKCHKDMGKVHNKWLSNPPLTLPSFAFAHFDVVSCAACHSPASERAVYLSLYDRMKGTPLSEEDLMKAFGTDSEGLMGKIDLNGDGIIDAKEMWMLFSHLLKKGTIATFTGKMDVQKPQEAHLIGSKGEAIKDCAKCHQTDADLFKNVFIVIKKAGGKPQILKAKADVLNSVYTILPASKFYALGSTSMKLFDILFIVALLGGIAVPIGHISLRIITSPLRALRRMGKGGKK
jgi:nitrate/TMAO reductase-like tetraheme cytochrome c subunit